MQAGQPCDASPRASMGRLHVLSQHAQPQALRCFVNERGHDCYECLQLQCPAAPGSSLPYLYANTGVKWSEKMRALSGTKLAPLRAASTNF